jgi:hypothetical protein
MSDTPSLEALNKAWHSPDTAIILPSELQVHFNWPGSEFINISLANIAAILAGNVVVLFRQMDDTIYLRLAPNDHISREGVSTEGASWAMEAQV